MVDDDRVDRRGSAQTLVDGIPLLPTVGRDEGSRGRAGVKRVGGLRIDVDTFKGVVTLSGRVKSDAERTQAVALARGIDGVAEVKDALQVIPE